MAARSLADVEERCRGGGQPAAPTATNSYRSGTGPVVAHQAKSLERDEARKLAANFAKLVWRFRNQITTQPG
jgi:hypothetical protein